MTRKAHGYRFPLTALAVLLIASGTPYALADAPSRVGQDEPETPGSETEDTKKDKETAAVRGCLRGTTLEEARAEEEIEGLTLSVSLRASRELRRQLKAYDRHEVEVTGRLTPPPKSPLSTKLGGATVSIGIADPRRPSLPEPRRDMATLEVESVRSLASSCTF